MADHLKPTITSTYANFVTEMDARFDDLAVGLDPAVTTATNVPTNSIRWVATSNKWQKYNGTAWNDLSALYSISISGNAGTVTNGVYSNASYANPAWITSLAGSKITGDISGKAGTATKLATARNINGVPFDGTLAISINTNQSVTFNNAGTGAASGTTFNGGTARTISYNTVGAPSTSGTNATGTWAISISGNADTVTSGVYTTGNQSIAGVKTFSSTIVGSINGNAATATSATSATTATNANNVAIAADTASTGTFYIPYASATTGNVALKGTRLTVQPSTGNFTAAGNIAANSDENLKTNWRSLPENYVSKLACVKHGIYDRIDIVATQVGVSAQSLQSLLPDAVQKDEEGLLSVAYGNAALVSVIELAKEIQLLKQEIELLKAGKQ